MSNEHPEDTADGDGADHVGAAGTPAGGPPGGARATGELLRRALVDDDDPRFPLWLPLPALVAAVAWALYDTAAGDGQFLAALIWPGVGIFCGTIVATWLGWQLDID